ncbi:hypothetical protein TNCV_1220241 [Trichonephila clavipes]|nr:hypothetical protein TNCV_1220241 [Trichonephila clavipes]
MKPAPFVRSYMTAPPRCFNFNVIGRNISSPWSFLKKMYLTGTELHVRNIRLPDSGNRLDVELKMAEISVHSRHNFNNPFLSGIPVERGKNMLLRVRQSSCFEDHFGMESEVLGNEPDGPKFYPSIVILVLQRNHNLRATVVVPSIHHRCNQVVRPVFLKLWGEPPKGRGITLQKGREHIEK